MAARSFNRNTATSSTSGSDAARTLSGRLAQHLAVKAAITVAAGIGVAVGTGSAARAGLQRQAKLAADRIGLADVPPPVRDGVFFPNGTYRGRTAIGNGVPRLRMAMLGDSTSAGFGVADADELPGVRLAGTLAAELGRAVQLDTYAVVGTGASDLARQAVDALADSPDLAVIIVGPNDVRARVSPTESVAALVEAVRTLRERGVAVVVATCPDLGVIAPIPAPLRQLAGHWSRSLAARQEHAVVKAGAVAVPIARLVSPGFVHHPELFAPDHFHPSGAGYALAVAVLMPAVFTALGIPAVSDRPAPLVEADAELLG